jgi:hypothetical protein
LWSEVGITATDGLGKLALAKLPSSVYAYEVAQDAPVAWWRLSEDGGTTMGDSSGSAIAGSYMVGTTALSGTHPNPWETVAAIEFDGEHCGTEGTSGVVVGARPVVVEMIASVDITDGFSTAIPLRTGSGLPAEGITFQFGDDVLSASARVGGNDFVQGNTENGVAHHYAYRCPAAGDASLLMDGVDISLTPTTTPGSSAGTSGTTIGAGKRTGTSTLTAPATGALADVAIYDTDIGTSRIEAHAAAFVAPWDGDTTGERIERLLDVVAWPSDLRDLATGFTTLSPAVLGGVALDAMRKCEASEQGRMFISRDGKLTLHDRYWSQLVAAGTTSQVTFSDAGSDVPYTGLAFDYDDRLVFGRIAGSTSGGFELTIEDATSLATYGDKTDATLNGLDVTPNVLRSLAEHRLLTYKEPSVRPRPITVALHDAAKVSDAEAEAILELDLGHRVTITRTPLVGSAITQEALVESITHSIKADEWNVTLSLSPAGITSYGLWGDDWGTLTWGP